MTKVKVCANRAEREASGGEKSGRAQASTLVMGLYRHKKQSPGGGEERQPSSVPPLPKDGSMNTVDACGRSPTLWQQGGALTRECVVCVGCKVAEGATHWMKSSPVVSRVSPYPFPPGETWTPSHTHPDTHG